MCPANQRWCYIVTSSLIGWAHRQNDPCVQQAKSTKEINSQQPALFNENPTWTENMIPTQWVYYVVFVCQSWGPLHLHNSILVWALLSHHQQHTLYYNWSNAKFHMQCIPIIMWTVCILHYNDIIMGTIAYQITSLTIVYSTFYSDADQRKH